MTYLNYDAGGFIVGVNKMNDGIDRVHDDTQEIIQILKSQNQIANTRMTELTRAVRKATYQASSQSSVNSSRERAASGRTSSPSRITGEPASITRQAPSASRRTQPNSNTQNIGSQARAARRNQGGNQAGGDTVPISRDSTNASTRTRSHNSDSPASTDAAGRERDARGRFTGGSSSASENERKKLGFGSLNGGRSDTSGIDPLVDSFREAKDLLSPIGGIGKLAGRGVNFSVSKLRAMKRREPLPNDQDRHNNENEKLLDKILKAIIKQRGNGGGGGLLGGLLGGGGRGRGGGLKNLFKKMGGLKMLGALSAVAGTAGLAMDWENLDHQGKSEGVGRLAGAGAGAIAGATVGSVVPVVGTAIGAVIGGWLGSEGGEWLGGVASPYIESWTSAITAYNLPAKMSDTWDDGIKPFFDRMDALSDKMSAWIDQQMTDIGDTISSTGAGLSEALGLADLGSVAEKYESGGRGVDTVSTGAGDHGGVSYGTHQLASKNGSMAAYLRSPEGQKFAGEFAGLSAGSAAFNKRYKDVASRRGDEFKKSQKDYITRTHYMPAKKIAEQYGFDTKNRGIQEAIYSHSTQYGANHKSRFKRIAESGVDMSDNEAVLKAFYADKARYVDSDFKSSSANVRAGVRKRIKSEKADVLAIAKVSDVKNMVKDAVAPEIAPKSKTGKYTGGIIGDDAREKINSVTNKDPSTNKVSSNFSDNTPMIFNSSTPASKDFGYAPANFPKAPTLSVPDMPKIKQRLDSGGDNKPIMIQSSNDSINQNVSDRSLAHAITGGLGQQRQWG